jgi:hypothetical protein
VIEVENDTILPSDTKGEREATMLREKRHINKTPRAYRLLQNPDGEWYSHGYEIVEWYTGDMLWDVEYTFPRTTTIAVDRGELISVGFETREFSTGNSSLYAEYLIRLMKDPPYDAEFIHEVACSPVTAKLGPLATIFCSLFCTSKLHDVVGYRYTISFLKRRAVPEILKSATVLKFDQRKRTRLLQAPRSP